MLERLLIKNLAVIEELEVCFSPGLTVLTGETGAGKSIIIDALNLILGSKASPELIRSGTDRAIIQGIFAGSIPVEGLNTLSEWGIEPEGELIISRELSGSRSHCRVNGRAVNVSALRELGTHLVDMHGQHEHQSLLRPSAHMHLLDQFGGTQIDELVKELRDTVLQHRRCVDELAEHSGDPRERARLIDLLEYQVSEIDAANISLQEELSLREEREQLLNFEKIATALTKSYEALYSGGLRQKAVVDSLGTVTSELKDARRHCPELGQIVDILEQAGFLVEDASRELSSLKENMVYEPFRLEQIEERFDVLTRLKGKYGDSLEQVLAFRNEAAASLERIHGSEQRVGELLKEQSALEERYIALSTKLSNQRKASASDMSKKVEKALQELGLKGARLDISVNNRIDSKFHLNGDDEVEFMFSANAGEEMRPLSKIASGGEISRVMLALKSVLTGIDTIPTLVFDEIDSGVGGKTAYSVADKIAEVAENRQVLCITHLPQIAAKAENHLFVRKKEAGGRTYTEVDMLDLEARVRELARMLSGEESTVALNHARELLKNNEK